jgi:hypothetical protein
VSVPEPPMIALLDGRAIPQLGFGVFQIRVFLRPAADIGECSEPVIQVNVQKSASTTLPCRSAPASGGEFSQPVAPSKPGT